MNFILVQQMILNPNIKLYKIMLIFHGTVRSGAMSKTLDIINIVKSQTFT